MQWHKCLRQHIRNASFERDYLPNIIAPVVLALQTYLTSLTPTYLSLHITSIHGTPSLQSAQLTIQILAVRFLTTEHSTSLFFPTGLVSTRFAESDKVHVNKQCFDIGSNDKFHSCIHIAGNRWQVRQSLPYKVTKLFTVLNGIIN